MLKYAAVAAFLTFSLTMTWGQQAEDKTADCAKLASLSLPWTTVVSSEVVTAGAFTPPGPEQPSANEKRLYGGTPAFCRVVLMDKPSADSAIPIEVWMPAKGWNGRFRGVGNGGFAGSIGYSGLALAVVEGYASAATDTGHAGSAGDAKWALGHPEKVIDYGYRAIHEMTVKAKAVMEAYYAAPARHTYFSACSDGGREALMEAQRFPEDYDGIVAGAPANNWTHMMATTLHYTQAMTLDPENYIPSSKVPAIQAAVLAECDAADGAKDGVINDPRSCHFKPATMVCKGAETDQCLTAKQAHTLEVLYAGGHDASGKEIFPGYLPGAEDGPGGWSLWITGHVPMGSAISALTRGYFADMVYERPEWDYKTASIEDAMEAASAKTGHALDATDPNLKPFLSHGGKLIVYHGWNDPAISALNTIEYYEAMRAATGEKLADSSVRLYMVPGMQHCTGGPGATNFGQFWLPPGSSPDDAEHDVNLAMEAWVEKGAVPQDLITGKYAEQAGHFQLQMTRPLCAYPRVAQYKGTGDTNDAANFTCVGTAK
jgi:feruloyl esterase